MEKSANSTSRVGDSLLRPTHTKGDKNTQAANVLNLHFRTVKKHFNILALILGTLEISGRVPRTSGRHLRRQLVKVGSPGDRPFH